MANKNIFIFVNSYKPILGGIQTVTSQLAEGFKNKGFDTTVITSLYPVKLKIFEKIDGVNIWRLPFTQNKTILEYLASIFTYILLFTLFFYYKPCSVYVHFPLDQSCYIIKLHKFFKFKLVVCFHGHDVLRYNEGETTDSRIYSYQKQLIDHADVVTSCSNYLGNEVKKIFGIKKVTTIYNGVDVSRFERATLPPSENLRPYVFSFGRLEHVKGFHLLIEAFAKTKISTKYKLLIAGSGSQKEKLQTLIKENGVMDRVLLLGRLSPKEIVRYCQHSSINVIPSLRESFGISAIEAMAAKRPLIATNAGGIPEIMYSPCGILVNPNVDDLVKALELIYIKIDDFDPSGISDHLKNFTINKMVDNYLKILNY